MIEQTASLARAIDGAISRMVQGATAAPLSIAGELDRYHGAREKTLAILREVTPAQALWSPAAGAWSIVQNADHLLLSEQLYRRQFEKLLSTGESISVSLREVDTFLAIVPAEAVPLFEVPMRVFNFFLPSAVREAIIRYPLVSARSPGISDPRPGLALEKLAADLALSLAETEKVLSGPLPANVDQLRIDHAVLGNNSVAQVLRNMTAHEERHHGQMARLRSNPNFPK